jgi:peptide/nickel transport system substrate-binding protein
MNREELRRLDEYRLNQAGELENALIDDFFTGEYSRGDFMRRATVLGLSATAIGAVLGTMGYAAPARAATGAVKAGGRFRLGIPPAPALPMEPNLFADHGTLATGSICGEYLTRTNADLTLSPELAASWKSNARGSVWTYTLRKGVKFASGQTMTAADVVATYKRITDPKGGGAALSAFKGVLQPSGIKAVGANTVVFTLDAPTSAFPYLTSNTTYQSIILPATYKNGTFTKTPQTTGAFNLVSYTPGVGAKFDRNPNWWGGKAPLEGVDATYYADESAAIAAVLSNQIDMMSQTSFANGRAAFGNPSLQMLSVKGVPHREISMLVSTAAAAEPFKNPLVRQALALTLDRPALVKQLLGGFGALGNDSPWGSVFPSTDKTVPQRHQDLVMAKKLMVQAGYPKGFQVTMTLPKYQEEPQLAQIIVASAKKIGIDIKLNIVTYTAYYAGTYSGGKTGRGTTPWLNTPLNITDYGHRAVPNVFLNSAFKTGGVWSSSNYANKTFDKVVDEYTAALTLSEQRKYAGIGQRILLKDTPVILPFFFNWNQAASKKVKGFVPAAIGTQYLSKTSLG